MRVEMSNSTATSPSWGAPTSAIPSKLSFPTNDTLTSLLTNQSLFAWRILWLSTVQIIDFIPLSYVPIHHVSQCFYRSWQGCCFISPNSSTKLGMRLTSLIDGLVDWLVILIFALPCLIVTKERQPQAWALPWGHPRGRQVKPDPFRGQTCLSSCSSSFFSLF